LFALVLTKVATAGVRRNVLLIAIDDMRNDLGFLGVEYAKTPELDGFANTARIFNHHCVQVPTCGASRCALMRGRYPSVAARIGNNGSKETQKAWATQSLPSVFLPDIYPTLIELAGLAKRTDLEGLSLVPQLTEATTHRDRPAITCHKKRKS